MDKLHTILYDSALTIVEQDTSTVEAYSSLQNYYRAIAPYNTEYIPYVIFYPTNSDNNVGVPAEYLLMELIETVTVNGSTYYAYETNFPPAVTGSARANKIDVTIAFIVKDEHLIGVSRYDETSAEYIADPDAYIASQLLIDYPDAVTGNYVRSFNTETDWSFNGTIWADTDDVTITNLVEHRGATASYTLRKGTSTTRPTHSPNNTESIIAILNTKLSSIDAYTDLMTKLDYDSTGTGDTVDKAFNVKYSPPSGLWDFNDGTVQGWLGQTELGHEVSNVDNKLRTVGTPDYSMNYKELITSAGVGRYYVETEISCSDLNATCLKIIMYENERVNDNKIDYTSVANGFNIGGAYYDVIVDTIYNFAGVFDIGEISNIIATTSTYFSSSSSNHILTIDNFKIMKITGTIYENSTAQQIYDAGVDITTVVATISGDYIYDELGLKEVSSNKIATFQITPDDTHYITEKLAKDQLDLKEDLSNKKIDLVDNSDTYYPSQKAVKTAVDLKANQATTYSKSEVDAKTWLENDITDLDKYTQAEVDAKVSALYKFKGSVATYADLAAKEATAISGDVWNVTDDETTGNAGVNYAWTGTAWDNIGGIEALATATNDGLMSQADFSALVLLKDRVNQSVAINSTPVFTSTTLYNVNGNAVFTIDDEGTVRVAHAGINHEIGENLFVRGEEVGTILNGDTVMYNGSIGASGKMELVTITSANIATLIANPHYFLGIATQAFSGIQNRLNWYGGVSDLDTTAYPSNVTYPAGAGKEIYVDMVNGGNTYIRPDKPLPVIKVGVVVTYHATQGRILVRPHCSVALNDLHDVDLNGGVVAGDIIKRNAGNTKFEVFNLDAALDPLEHVVLMTYVSGGQFKATIDNFTLSLNRDLTMLFPNTLTDLTTAVQVSFDNGVTYKYLKYDDTLNSVVVKHTQKAKVTAHYDNTEWVMKGEPLISETISHDKMVSSSYGLFKPISGLAQLNQVNGLMLNQPVVNGNFDSGDTTFWTTTASGFTVTNEVATFLATAQYNRIDNVTGLVAGLDYYVISRIKSTSNNVRLYLYDGSNITVGTHSGSGDFEILSGIVTAVSTLSTGGVRVQDNRASDWDNIYIDYLMVIPITNTPLYNKSASDISKIIPTYFEGTKWITNPKVKSVGVNLFDLTQYTSVDYAYKIRVNPSSNVAWSVSTQYKLYDINSNEISTGTALTVATTADTAYIAFVGTIADKDTFMLNEGTSALTWQPRKTETQELTNIDGSDLDMLSVGTDIWDIAYPLNGKWWKDKKVARDYNDVVQSAITWNIQSILANTHSFRYDFTSDFGYKIPSSVTVVNAILKINGETYIPSSIAVEASTDTEKLFSVQSGGLRIRVNKTTYPDSAAFEALLNTGNVEFIYELADKETTEIESNGSIIQEPITTIIQENVFATTMEIEYAGNIKSQVKIHSDKLTKHEKEMTEVEVAIDDMNVGQMEDWKFPATQQRQGATTKPDFDFTNIGLLFPENDETEISYVSDQRPHSMEDDTLLQPHCHLILTQSGNPKFTAMVLLTNIDDNEGSWVQYDMETLTSAWVSGRHHVMLYNTTMLASTGKLASAVLDVKLYRQTGDGYTGDVLLKSFDIHYYRNKFGEDI